MFDVIFWPKTTGNLKWFIRIICTLLFLPIIKRKKRKTLKEEQKLAWNKILIPYRTSMI